MEIHGVDRGQAMFPYLVLLGSSIGPALGGVRRPRISMIIVMALLWLMVGLRFQVGSDWNSYVHMYNLREGKDVWSLLNDQEIGFRLLIFVASATGGGVVLINIVSAAIFSFGLFKFVMRCLEPFLALAIATPYLVIVVAMSATRQAIAIGLVLYLFATWEQRQTLSRILFILFSSLFHFSSIFLLVFVALGSRISPLARVLSGGLILLVTLPLIVITSSRIDVYGQRYLGGAEVTPEGALVHVALVAIPAVAYLMVRHRWRTRMGTSALLDNVAYAAAALLPATFIAPVPADRMSLYFWPIAMYVGSGWPSLIEKSAARNGYRILVVAACLSVLVGWFTFANHSRAYLPYKNYLLQPDGVRLLRPRL